MAKEIYLYSGIYSFVAERLITELNDLMGVDVTMRANSGGGDVHAFWGIAAKMMEHGNVTYQVDGAAFSSAANLAFYAKKVTCLDVSNFVFHRADGYVSSPEDQQYLDKINADLKKKMLAKIDAADFKEITGYTIDDIFDPEKRINIYLNASQMKKLGLVDKVVKLEAAQVEAFNKLMIAASHEPESPVKKTDMTIEKLKAEFPAVYAEIVKNSITSERERVSAWMEFSAIDAEAVKKGIDEGAEITGKVLAAMTVKAAAKGALATIENESPGAAGPGAEGKNAIAATKTEAQKELEEFSAKVDKSLGRETKAKV